MKSKRSRDEGFMRYAFRKAVMSLMSVKVEVFLLAEAATIGIGWWAGHNDPAVRPAIFSQWVDMQKVLVSAMFAARVIDSKLKSEPEGSENDEPNA